MEGERSTAIPARPLHLKLGDSACNPAPNVLRIRRQESRSIDAVHYEARGARSAGPQ